jgi:hypothetical protein
MPAGFSKGPDAVILQLSRASENSVVRLFANVARIRTCPSPYRQVFHQACASLRKQACQAAGGNTVMLFNELYGTACVFVAQLIPRRGGIAGLRTWVHQQVNQAR